MDDDSDRALPEEAQAAIKTSTETVYVAEGPGAVPRGAVEDVFGNSRIVRLYGNDGYDTSNQIACWMVANGKLSADSITVACGATDAHGVDALAGSMLAGSKGGVLLLANENESMEPLREPTLAGSDSEGTQAFLLGNASKIKQAYVLGGTYVMPETVVQRINGALPQLREQGRLDTQAVLHCRLR